MLELLLFLTVNGKNSVLLARETRDILFHRATFLNLFEKLDSWLNRLNTPLLHWTKDVLVFIYIVSCRPLEFFATKLSIFYTKKKQERASFQLKRHRDSPHNFLKIEDRPNLMNLQDWRFKSPSFSDDLKTTLFFLFFTLHSSCFRLKVWRQYLSNLEIQRMILCAGRPCHKPIVMMIADSCMLTKVIVLFVCIL